MEHDYFFDGDGQDGNQVVGCGDGEGLLSFLAEIAVCIVLIVLMAAVGFA